MKNFEFEYPFVSPQEAIANTPSMEQKDEFFEGDQLVNTIIEFDPNADWDTQEACRVLEVTRVAFFTHGKFGLIGRRVAGGRQVYKAGEIMQVRDQIEQQRASDPTSIPRNVEIPEGYLDIGEVLRELGIGLTAFKEHKFFDMQPFRFSGMSYYFKSSDVEEIKEKYGFVGDRMSFSEVLKALGVSSSTYSRNNKFGIRSFRAGNSVYYLTKEVQAVVARVKLEAEQSPKRKVSSPQPNVKRIPLTKKQLFSPKYNPFLRDSNEFAQENADAKTESASADAESEN